MVCSTFPLLSSTIGLGPRGGAEATAVMCGTSRSGIRMRRQTRAAGRMTLFPGYANVTYGRVTFDRRRVREARMTRATRLDGDCGGWGNRQPAGLWSRAVSVRVRVPQH